MTATTGPAPGLLAQSLAKGAAGTALAGIELSLAGDQPWPQAHAQITAATSQPVIASPRAGLFYGAPAISFILHCAQADGIPRYRTAAGTVDAHVRTLAGQRLHAAAQRMRGGQPADFAEYDLFYGLTGIAALLLHHSPREPLLGRILDYLVRLTLPRPDGLPGWWAGHDPDPALPTTGGHANLGMAHGAAGILAILAATARHGLTVDGHHDAMNRICGWYRQWQQESPAGPWWPQWITREQLACGQIRQPRPARASWCYGTPGISRALQQAAAVLTDTALQRTAEQALAGCLTDPAQMSQVTSAGLCHGTAGIYQTAWRAARSALTPAIREQMPRLAGLLRSRSAETASSPGLLDGAAGLALAQRTAADPARAPLSGWDACLLIN